MGTVVSIIIGVVAGSLVQVWTEFSQAAAPVGLASALIFLAPYRLWVRARQRIAALEARLVRRIRFTAWRAQHVGGGTTSFEVQVENESETDELRANVTLTRMYAAETGGDIQLGLALPVSLLPANHPHDGTSSRFNLDGKTKRQIVVASAEDVLHINHAAAHEGVRTVANGVYIVELQVTPSGETKKFQLSSTGERGFVPVDG